MKRFILVLAILWSIPAFALEGDEDVPAGYAPSSGHAPLAVHFNADLILGNTTNQPFNQYEYVWNYGDPNSGTWPTSGLSKNMDYGAIGKHVYENPGTYTATVNVFNQETGASIASMNEAFTVTVTDTDDFYAGDKTTCISTGTNFAGCPAGAQTRTIAAGELTTGLAQYIQSGERALLKRGDTWAVTDGFANAGSTNAMVGAFGTCTNPDRYGICENEPTINANVASAQKLFSLNNTHGFRITHLIIVGSGFNFQVGEGTTNITDLFIGQTKYTSGFWGLNIGTYRFSNLDFNNRIMVYQNDWLSVSKNHSYCDAERVAYLGNSFAESMDEHIIRSPQSYIIRISHNELSGGPNRGHEIKYHGPDEGELGDYEMTGNAGKAHRSLFGIISDNTIGGGGAYAVNIGPRDANDAQQVSNVLVERNIFAVNYKNKNYVPNQLLRVSADYVTARNNTFNMTDPTLARSVAGVTLAVVAPTTPPNWNYIYNNTFYSLNSGLKSRIGVDRQNGSNNFAYNNLASFPGSTATKLATEGFTATNIESNNYIADNMNFVDANAPVLVDADFHLTVSTPAAAKDSGLPLPRAKDMDFMPVANPPDLGAFEYVGGAQSPPILSNIMPQTAQAAGTTQVDVTFTTNNPASCTYGYSFADNQDNDFAQTNATSFSATETGLTDGMTPRVVHLRCCNQGTSECTTSDYTATISVSTSGEIQPLAPWDKWPADGWVYPADVGEATFSCLVDPDPERLGICRWIKNNKPADSTNQTEAEAAYNAMPNAMNQTDYAHNSNMQVSVLNGSDDTYWLLCKDNSVPSLYMLSAYGIRVQVAGGDAGYTDVIGGDDVSTHDATPAEDTRQTDVPRDDIYLTDTAAADVGQTQTDAGELDSSALDRVTGPDTNDPDVIGPGCGCHAANRGSFAPCLTVLGLLILWRRR